MLTNDPRRRRLVRAIVFGALAAVIVAMGAALASGSSGSTGTVNTRKTSLGTILADAHGRTLYMFMKDKRDKSTCSGSCARFWPPLTTTAKPTAGSGAKAALLGTTKRSDGRTQVTYNGHPLYTFLLDAKAGQTKGEAIQKFGGTWYAVSPSGTKVVHAASSGGGYGGGGGGYGGGGGGGY